MSNYISVDIDECRRSGHRFSLIWSDKTPLKVSLSCETCSAEVGKTAIAAFGIDTLSWGQWRRRKQEQE